MEKIKVWCTEKEEWVNFSSLNEDIKQEICQKISNIITTACKSQIEFLDQKQNPWEN